MKPNNYLQYILLAGIFTITLFSCRKSQDCSDSSANLPSPITVAEYRVIDNQGRDLLASITPGKLSFDSLVASQPCNKNNSLGKKKIQIGAGGLEGYKFSFNNVYQPIPSERDECFTIQLNWGSDNTDQIQFVTRAEHHVCGITYYLDAVYFNGREAKKDGNGVYLLRK